MHPESEAKQVDVEQVKSVVVRPIERAEQPAWRQLMKAHHYLGFRVLVGHSMKYVATLNGRWVALLGWGGAAFKVGVRDEWIGWSPHQQWQRLHLVVNNLRFLILPGVHLPNLASRVLALNLRRLSQDWQVTYGHPVMIAETFVDPSRFRGTCYRAAGFVVLGQTQGFGRNAGRYFNHGAPKTLLVRTLHPHARRLLAASFLSPELYNGGEKLADLNLVNIEQERGLLERLEQLKDSRKSRGVRHSQASILAVAVCAFLSGARSLAAMAEWGSKLSVELLKRLKCRWRPRDGKWVAPSEPTLRRALQSVDAEELDRVVGEWLQEQADSNARAVDGKALRGSAGSRGKPVRLLSSLLHKERVVLGQQVVWDNPTEITALHPLLATKPSASRFSV